MDYEKKYKEALEKAKEWEKKYILTNTISPDGTMAKEFKEIFCQFTESEDEKIRKAIMSRFQERIRLSEEEFPVYTQEEVAEDRLFVAWLEKQKDASKAIEAVDRIDKYIDEHLANAHDMKDSNPDKKYYRGWDDALGKMSGILQDVYSGEKQKEQKPFNVCEQCPHYWDCPDSNERKSDTRTADDLQLLGFIYDLLASLDWRENYAMSKEDCLRRLNEYRPQKPAERSEEDDKMRLEAIRVLESGCERYIKESGCLPSWHIVIAWLKSLRPQPKQEWSEDDENKLNHILEIVHIASGTEASVDEKEELESFLQSLRPQPRKEIYQAARHDLAIKFMNYLDENRPERKMSLSSGECEDIDKAFKENNWAKILEYANKYKWKPSEEDLKDLLRLKDSMPNNDWGNQMEGFLEDLIGNLKKQ